MKEYPTSSSDGLAELGLALYMHREVFQLHPFGCEGMKQKASCFLGLSPSPHFTYPCSLFLHMVSQLHKLQGS